MINPCRLCPRNCGAKRLEGEKGFCGAGSEARVAYCGPHFGEEPPLTGTGGAGTVFFAGCSLKCIYCQNWQISHENMGRNVTPEVLADMFLALQDMGAHNIDLVTPSHITAQLLEALYKARQKGLRLPLVHNNSGYESLETLAALDGVVDIYLADMKYGSGEDAARLSGAPDYPETARVALREMLRQVGPLTTDERGLARRGLLVRHLVLPKDLSATGRVLRFVAEMLGPETPVSLMCQYRPAHRAGEIPAMARPLTRQEYRGALREIREARLANVYVQRFDSARDGLPDFTRSEPFRWR